jgi:FkbM family methyltransferase
VTKAFYDRGWSGINVEPGPRFEALAAARPRDRNLNCAIGPAGTLTLHEIASGLSTVDPSIAESHRRSGHEVETRVVQVLPLNEVLRRFEVEVIHFLKVDVEGAEEQVLRTLDLALWRPWLVVVEATAPLTDTPTHAAWEPLLVSAAYQHVWFDGLNRWYVAGEHHARLACHFDRPPNFLDHFVTHREHVLREALQRVHSISDDASLARYRLPAFEAYPAP